MCHFFFNFVNRLGLIYIFQLCDVVRLAITATKDLARVGYQINRRIKLKVFIILLLF
jgi:hypothetical protein